MTISGERVVSNRTVVTLFYIFLVHALVASTPATVSATNLAKDREVGILVAKIAKLKGSGSESAKLALAELQMQLGAIYQENGEFSKSQTCFSTALQIRSQPGSGQTPEVPFRSDPSNDTTRTQRDELRGSYSGSSLAAGQARHSKELLIAQSKMWLGDSLRAQGKFSDAEKYLTEAHKSIEANAPASIEEATSLNRLASLYNNWGNFSKAESLQREALAIAEKHLKAADNEIAIHKLLLADTLRQQGKYKAAEPYLQAAVANLKKANPRSREYAAALNNLGALYFWMGDYSRAEPLLERGLNLREEICGNEHIDVANSLGDLAALNYQKANYTVAQKLFQKALAIREKQLGTNHPLTASTMSNLGNVYATTGQTAKAKTMLTKAVSIKERTLDPNSPDLAQGLNDLAELCIDARDFQQAERLVNRAKTIREKTLGKTNPDLAASWRTEARLNLQRGKLEQAKEDAQRALAIYNKALAPNHPELRETKALLNAITKKQSKRN